MLATLLNLLAPLWTWLGSISNANTWEQGRNEVERVRDAFS
ncbi:hypothetical protein LMG27177_06877 [Paraburkholderia fynbosensis]|uniref:Uncharacterized protein n=1 Tax=Paraburkholderia fynbosensis TaxID=1200993 RepID=A0A6J5GZV1_9BURK|nr:hypothetical protein LMG27177_06877 [Paraburkholderia fynbosensis]